MWPTPLATMEKDEKLEAEAIHEGIFAKDMKTGRLIITQLALKCFIEHQRELELLEKQINYALYHGADVEMGMLDAGVFIESDRKPNWRTEFVALGGDPQIVLDRTLRREHYRTRVFLVVKLPKGRRIAPTGGEPLDVKPETGETEHGQD